MGRIAEGKKLMGAEIEADCEEMATILAGLIVRARESASDARGLNGLGATLNGFASTLETAGSQLSDARTECRAWLEQKKPASSTITERSVELVKDERASA